MDKKWMDYITVKERSKPEYRNGVIKFLDFAFDKVGGGGKIRCPCNFCNNGVFHTRDEVFEHLIVYGVLRTYKLWNFHGEVDVAEVKDKEIEGNEEIIGFDETISLIHDVTNIRNANLSEDGDEIGCETKENDEMREKFVRLMNDANQELYPGCKKFSKLEFIVHLLHLKCINSWSDNSFTMLLKLLKQVFLHDQNFPSSAYEAKKYSRDLGLNYVKIDACKNDCVLFRKKYVNYERCPVCDCSRWKDDHHEGDARHGMANVAQRKKIPQKILRHFPLVPRLQRLYMSSKLASHMRWHKEERIDDGVLRHPADAQSWKSLDEMYPNFSSDSRNVRLGLSTDGFNPFGNLSSTYSIWPVVLVPYNLPPWLCMKKEFFMLSLLIPGDKAPGNNIDVYLEPLIEELKELWEDGVDTYDALSSSYFKLHAVLLWTISDFPAYANLSGWSTKGALACPSCNLDTCSQYLKNGHKFCYMRHRRFLEDDHRWRRDKKSFDGTVECRAAPKQLSGEEILDQFIGCENITFGKPVTKRKRSDSTLKYNWKKQSIFFQLPYWSKLLIRHTLDVMHIEKNICDNILGTVMGITGKTKDNVNSRLDIEQMGIHKDLHLIPKNDGKYEMPVASYSLTLKERRDVCKFLSDVKVPDGYSSNIAKWVNVNDGKIIGMKSHDCHIFLQDLLAPTFRGILPKHVYEPLVEVGMFFKQLCSKSIRLETLEKLEHNIALTLCKLEKIFLPSFFDIMVHLPIHLPAEVKLTGPVQYHWMFPFERDMQTYKISVRNKARPEGSIAESYIANECLTFCSRYLERTETRFNRTERNSNGVKVQNSDLSIFSVKGKPLSKGKTKELSYQDWRRAHLYALRNCEEVQPYLEINDNTSLKNVRLYEGANVMQDVDFVKWFESTVTSLWKGGDDSISKDLLKLSQGPMKRVTCYDAYAINGFRFHTRERALKRKTQNSGVIVRGDDYSGGKDYFGLLTEVIELEYDDQLTIVLFRCDWYDIYDDQRGIKKDKNGIVSLNISKFLKSDEPYVLASQVEQVYYVNDQLNSNWRVVVKTTPRNFYDMPLGNCNDDDMEQLMEIREVNGDILDYSVAEDNVATTLVREDMDPRIVDDKCTRMRKRDIVWSSDEDEAAILDDDEDSLDVETENDAISTDS